MNNMNNNFLTYAAWFMLCLALIAVGLVGFFAWTISTDQTDRLAHAEKNRKAALEKASAIRTHALVRDTEKQRTELNTLLDVDVVSAAYMIEAVGKSAGVAIKLGDAVPENIPSSSGSMPLKAVGFVVEADGKFSALMRAMRLLETLPLPSTLTSFDIEHVPASAGSRSDQWHMNVSVHILTTSDISS